VIEHPKSEHIEIPVEDPSDVLHGLASTESNLVLLEHDGHSSEIGGRHLRRHPGPRRRLLEEQTDPKASPASCDAISVAFHLGSEIDEMSETVGADIADLYEVHESPSSESSVE
jgi:hypothetical protein